MVPARHSDARRYVHTFILVKHLFVYNNEYLCVIGSVYHAEILSHISQRSNTIFVVARALIVWRSIQLCGDYCVPFLCSFVFKQRRVQHSSNASFFCLHPLCSSSSAHKTPAPPSAREVHKRCFCQDKRKERKRAAVLVVMHRISELQSARCLIVYIDGCSKMIDVSGLSIRPPLGRRFAPVLRLQKF